MNKSTSKAASIAAISIVGTACFLAGSFVKPSSTAHASTQTKSVPGIKSSVVPADLDTEAASQGTRHWRCLAEKGGYFTDSEAEAKAHLCAEVKLEPTVWQCVDGAGRAQYSPFQSGLTGMSCVRIHGLDSSEWVETLNSPAFRQWIENQQWEVREQSRSDDAARVRALVQSYFEEMADASEIREKYADWKAVMASKAFNDWLSTQPPEVQAMKAELTIGHVRQLMERYMGTNPRQVRVAPPSPAV